jgi:hypothetical protein
MLRVPDQLGPNDCRQAALHLVLRPLRQFAAFVHDVSTSSGVRYATLAFHLCSPIQPMAANLLALVPVPGPGGLCPTRSCTAFCDRTSVLRIDVTQ